LLPSPSFAGEVGVEVQFAAVSLGVRGFGWPGVHEESEDVRTGYAAYGGGARGCGLLPLDSLVWTGCAGFSAAAVRGAAESSEAIRSDSATAPWYSVSAAVGVDWPRDSRIRLRATGELSVSLNRPRFRIEGGETTHRVSALVPLLAAGVLLVL
jgi:hypothetical protein